MYRNENIFNEQTIIFSSEYNLLIGVYPPRTYAYGYYLDPYFKIFNNKSERSADRVARISILRPEYIIHNGKDGKKNFKLNKNEIAFMLKMFRDPLKGYESAWRCMLDYLTNLANGLNIPIKYDYNYPIPDYTKLK